MKGRKEKWAITKIGSFGNSIITQLKLKLLGDEGIG